MGRRYEPPNGGLAAENDAQFTFNGHFLYIAEWALETMDGLPAPLGVRFGTGIFHTTAEWGFCVPGLDNILLQPDVSHFPHFAFRCMCATPT